jgi:hypothetical protein
VPSGETSRLSKTQVQSLSLLTVRVTFPPDSDLSFSIPKRGGINFRDAFGKME